MTTADLFLQYETDSGQFHCVEFRGVPAARKGWICLAAAAEAARGYVSQLALAIRADLLRSGAVQAEEVPCPVDPSVYDPSKDAERRKVLFLIPSEDAPLHDLAWYANWNSDDFLSHVMVAAKAGKYIEMFHDELRTKDKETHLLRAVNATYWQARIDEVVPEIFQRAEVTSTSSRIFISYRRTDTLNLALQLFDELTHKGFDTFLDRFSIPSGYDFQRRLSQELLDKSMVVLLESTKIQDSDWTRHEISFTTRNRLGLLTVPMPDVDPKSYLGSTARMALTKADFVEAKADSTEMWGVLTQDALSKLVAEIKRVHAESLFKRRERLRTEIVSTLNANGVPLPYCSAGPFRLTQRSIDHIIYPTSRPPNVDDFSHVYHSYKVPPVDSERGVLVGPCATFELDRQKRLRWLETVTKCETFDEGKLADLASWLLTGTRP